MNVFQSRGELLALQVVNFGLIPDRALMRGRWFFQDGALRSHALPGLALDSGLLLQYSALQVQYDRLAADLQDARRKLDELTAQPPVLPSNVIRFPGCR